MSEEEKGFVVKDHRSLDQKGELKDKSPEEKPGGEHPPLPEADFTSLIFSLSSTALFHLGEIPDPQTGENAIDLSLAKHAIDTISMLQEKAAGNLTNEEQKFTESVLTDLRWRFVKAKKQSA